MLRLLDYWKAHFLSRRILGEKGAVRVHGGFARTVVAFVLKEISSDYKKWTEYLVRVPVWSFLSGKRVPWF